MSSFEESCKLRLFGFELETGHGLEMRREKASSSEKLGSDKKLECQYCLKVFGNSQALGGHQNAHKKERMRKKKLQLQARKRLLQPFNNSNYSTWLYDPSCHAFSESVPDQKQQISFRPYDSDYGRWSWNNSSRVVDRSSSQQNILTLSPKPADGSKKMKIWPSSCTNSKKLSDGESLDLQLGLSLYSTV